MDSVLESLIHNGWLLPYAIIVLIILLITIAIHIIIIHTQLKRGNKDGRTTPNNRTELLYRSKKLRKRRVRKTRKKF